MPVTKTAKRALRVSTRKKNINTIFKVRLEKAIRFAKKQKSQEAVKQALSLIDRSVKKNIIHKNKAAHLKSALSKLLPYRAKDLNKTTAKKSIKAVKKTAKPSKKK